MTACPKVYKLKNNNKCVSVKLFVNCSVHTVFDFVLSSLTQGQLPTFSIASHKQLIKINLKRHSVILTLKQTQIIITNDTRATGELELEYSLKET